MQIENDVKLDFDSVLIRPKRSTLTSRKDVTLTRSYSFKHSKVGWAGIPIMASNMDGVGTVKIANILQDHGLFTCLVKYNEEDISQLNYNHFAISTGTSSADFQNLKEAIEYYAGVKFICIDVANGYRESFCDFVSKVRETFSSKTIIAGNVVTADMTQELILRGADIVKVGIGPGSVCTTRKQTGVGYPQLSAIIECADAAHALGGHIIADGGCTCPGDIAKAFGAGADFVMLGGMLAGTDEGGGKIITKIRNTGYIFKVNSGTDDWPETEFKNEQETKKFVKFYGMSSESAMKKYHGGVAKYRSSEGAEIEIPYKGSIESVVLDILGGLRSSCTYVGASHLKDLSKCCTFVRVNKQFNTVYA